MIAAWNIGRQEFTDTHCLYTVCALEMGRLTIEPLK